MTSTHAPEPDTNPTHPASADRVATTHVRSADVRQLWAASDGGAHSVLGVSADGPLVIDLVADGPHALIAGTTGSGKSELLRSLVIGLALSHPPDQLTFLLVDYKGGAAFAECSALPHAVGLVTDLDVQLTRRALRSLHAELLRRERLLAGVGADDLPGYRQRNGGRSPLPRLVIVVDEFAALAEELPDFVTGLVGVAQRGRSLGLHLVLATQRPGTAVSAEIRANTSLRIALRVTDTAESVDVVGAADAAHLDPRHPGRAWVRTGSAYTCVQTGLVSGVRPNPDPRPRVELLGPWRSPPVSAVSRGTTQGELAGLVEVITTAAQAMTLPPMPGPWLPPLPAALRAGALSNGSPPTGGVRAQIPIGLLDLPDQQTQVPLTVSLAGGSFLLAGRAGSGRTTALATLALGAADAAPPDELTLYVIDGSGGLASLLHDLPHAATVLGADDGQLAATLLERLLKSHGATTGQAPALLVLDAWDVVLGGLDDGEAAHLGELLSRLLRTAPPNRLTVALAGGRSILVPRIAALFPTRLVLDLHDRTDFAAVGVSTRDVPSVLPPGRGVRADDGALFQLAHPGTAPTAGAAAAESDRISRRWLGVPAGHGVIRLRALPDHIGLAEIRAQESAPGGGRTRGLLLGIGGDAGVPFRLDIIGRQSHLLVAGPPRSGKSTALHTLLVEACAQGVSTTLACTRRSPLADVAVALGVPVLDPGRSAVIGPAPDEATLLLIDDSEAFVDGALADDLVAWIRNPAAPLTVVAAGRSDDVATAYRGVAAEVRRHRCGLLLQPGPLDGELLGIRTHRRTREQPPGRGVLVGEPRWGPWFATGAPVPIQIAKP